MKRGQQEGFKQGCGTIWIQAGADAERPLGRLWHNRDEGDGEEGSPGGGRAEVVVQGQSIRSALTCARRLHGHVERRLLTPVSAATDWHTQPHPLSHWTMGGRSVIGPEHSMTHRKVQMSSMDGGPGVLPGPPNIHLRLTMRPEDYSPLCLCAPSVEWTHNPNLNRVSVRHCSRTIIQQKKRGW